MPKLKVYSCNQVKCIVGVFPVESGRSDGDFIKISPKEDRYIARQGVDGETTRSDTGACIVRVTVTVMQTSSANAYFSALYNGDIAADGGAGVVPLGITDLGGRSLFASAEAWIPKMPDQTYAKEAGTIDWDFDCIVSVNFAGGN